MATYSHGCHCKKCNRKIHNPRRSPPRCCGKPMINDYDARLVVRPAPATVSAALIAALDELTEDESDSELQSEFRAWENASDEDSARWIANTSGSNHD